MPDRKFTPSGDKPFENGMNSLRFFASLFYVVGKKLILRLETTLGTLQHVPGDGLAKNLTGVKPTGYVAQLLDVEKRNPGPTPETTLKLEEEAAGLDEQIKALEGNMSELLPCPVSLCAHNFKYKNNKKRSAEPILRPAKLTLKNNNDKSKNLDDEEFKLPRKTSKGTNVPMRIAKLSRPKINLQLLNAADKDVEVVTLLPPN
ncbi:hypothetical protein TNCV_1447631 [Trichonephila clavipes]|nr:hypothetical protein TNCV_1447631 [Trichonephila clavipes]